MGIGAASAEGRGKHAGASLQFSPAVSAVKVARPFGLLSALSEQKRLLSARPFVRETPAGRKEEREREREKRKIWSV